MKILVVVSALALSCVLPGLPNAQASDWLLDWHVSQDFPAPPGHFDFQGVSPATLTPRPDLDASFTPIYHPDGPVYELDYTYNGQTFGGLVAQGNYQLAEPPGFTMPAPPPFNVTGNMFTYGFFDLHDGTFTSEIGGASPFAANWTATGTEVAGAVEPGTLALAAIGLVVAALGRRAQRRREK